MAQIIRADTQAKVRVGPFVDATDAVTPETGITLGAADQAEILKADGAATVDISGATWAAVTGADGWYDLTLTTSHTDTEGDLTVVVQDASVCLPVFARFQVVASSVYDSIWSSTLTELTDTSDLPSNFSQMSIEISTGRVDVAKIAGTAQTARDLGASVLLSSGTGTGQVSLSSGVVQADVAAISTSTTAADNLEASALGIIPGSTSGTPSTTATDTNLSGYLDDELIGRVIVFTGGTAAGQAATITDYASTNGVVSFAALTTAPAASDTFVIV